MFPTRTPETLSKETYPYRCGLGDGCPLLFTQFTNRKYCVFVKQNFVNGCMRNPKCPRTNQEVIKGMVLRVDDQDW